LERGRGEEGGRKEGKGVKLLWRVPGKLEKQKLPPLITGKNHVIARRGKEDVKKNTLLNQGKE